MRLKNHASPSHFPLSISSKSHFRLVKWQKMSSECPKNTCIIAFATSNKSQFGRKWVKLQYVSLKYRSFNLTQVAFSVVQDGANQFAVPSDHLKHGFLELTQVVLWAGQKAESEFKVPWEHLKNHFNGIPQNAFWAGQEAENDFEVQCELLKHSFLNLNQVAF